MTGMRRMTDCAEPTSPPWSPEWLDWTQAAPGSGSPPAKVRTMIRDHELAAAVPVPGGGPQVPADFIAGRAAGQGAARAAHRAPRRRYDDRESIAWLFPDPDLPGRPIDALRENRGSEVKRRAQAMAL